MTKYRRLSASELADLESQFVQFLVANTVTAADWVNIKQREPQHAIQLIDIFSDMVFENSLNKVEYLKFKAANDIKVFKCSKDKIILLGISVEADSPVDFSDEVDLPKLLLNHEGLSVYRAEKKYKGDRLREIFEMMEGGALISDGSLFAILEKIY